MVFDNISTVAKLHVSLDENHPENELIPGPEPIEQFEDITYSVARQRFYIVIENAEIKNNEAENIGINLENHAVCFKPKICEYDEHFKYLDTHNVDYVFADKNKGLEGLAVISRNNQEYVLGLCEAGQSNTAQGINQTPLGIGIVLVLKKNTDCWRLDSLINLPKSVQFGDYAGIDIRDNRVAVVSQVSSTLWVGQFEQDSWQFVDEGKVYQFPRSKTNEVKYCNVEGVTWIDRDTVAVVSDKRKSIDAVRCKKKDQSIHIFKIPT